MKKSTKLFTTSEYINALKSEDGNVFRTVGKDFLFFSNIDSAEYDAEWLKQWGIRNGEKIKKPTLYRVKFERVGKK